MTDYLEYLERYAKAREISTAEAETHLMVQEVKQFYEAQHGKDVKPNMG